MRAAPIGFTYLITRDLKSTFDIAVDSARVTHGHPSGYLSAGALAAIIAMSADGQNLPEAVSAAIRLTSSIDGSREVCEALERAVLISREPKWRDRLPELGGAWVVRRRWL